ncbi:alpha-glucosidase [Mesobaculum littorinae]|uniref:Alpha-glucosidase n=1 Tax=Mesobaculum littorinae TaxID=2486419 RepID=A0A438AIU9_9RHOB|nr:alpha-glucosidase family protein [Mesobaculum littorinae]RVV98545.1 alpha-glucosidase [Mesobaculum littorinae]
MTATKGDPWWRGAVIYQVYPRSFRDTGGDGIGDLPGITEKLEHIASLGVDALWISPFFLSPMKDFGYDVADYRQVDPMFGSNEDFDDLLARAHDLGLKVMVDMVLCHTSDQHPFFAESRSSRDNDKADWYVWRDAKPDGNPPNNWLSVFGGPAWSWNHTRKQYYLHNFLSSQPALNWNNEEVVEAMLGECRFWLDKGVDGLRLDAIPALVVDPELRDNPPLEDGDSIDVGGAPGSPFRMQNHKYDRDLPHILPLLERLRALTDDYGDRFLLGEVGDVDSIPVSAKYSHGEDRLHSCYTFQLLNALPTAPNLRKLIDRYANEMNGGWPTLAFGNHDVERTVTRWAAHDHLTGDTAAVARLVLAVLVSIRGSVILYQGEELGLTEVDLPFEAIVDPYGLAFWPDYKGRDGSRTPMPWTSEGEALGFSESTPWLPVGPDHAALSVAAQDGTQGTTLHFAKALFAWRQERHAMRCGSLDCAPGPETVLAFSRENDSETVLCVFNLSNAPAEWTAPEGWVPEEDAPQTGVVEGQLPPYGIAFFRRV